MARKTKIVSIPGELGQDPNNRDAGKNYLLTEMDAMRAEKWATRALMALARSGVDVGEDLMGAGMAGLVAVGVRAVTTLDFDEAEPLLDEMLACVQFVPDYDRPEITRPLVANDFEEVSTLLRIRSEVMELHTGFSVAAALSSLGAAAKDKAAHQSNMQMSPDQSE